MAHVFSIVIRAHRASGIKKFKNMQFHYFSSYTVSPNNFSFSCGVALLLFGDPEKGFFTCESDGLVLIWPFFVFANGLATGRHGMKQLDKVVFRDNMFQSCYYNQLSLAASILRQLFYAKVVVDWKKWNRIVTLECPVQSSDLKPINNLRHK